MATPRILLLAPMLALLLLVTASPAGAQDSLPTITGPVTDPSGLMTSEGKKRVRAAFEQLDSLSGIAMYAVYLDTTGIESVDEFAARTAEVNGLGGHDGLLLVVVADRATALWLGDDLQREIGETERSAIVTAEVEPHLAAADFAGAAVSAAERLRPAGTTVPAPAADASPGAEPAGDTPERGSGPLEQLARLPLPLLLVASIALLAGYLALKRRLLGPN